MHSHEVLGSIHIAQVLQAVPIIHWYALLRKGRCPEAALRAAAQELSAGQKERAGRRTCAPQKSAGNQVSACAK